MERLGRYEIHGQLGAGGMAVVHLGRICGEGGFSRPVAIKRLPGGADASVSSLLLEEAKLTARIQHTNVVPMLDVIAEGNALAIVMDYVHGETLSSLLERAARSQQRCPPPVAVRIVHDVLLGLHAAHEATDLSGARLEIIHRDVSPQNVLVGTDGTSRVLDFGIARAIGRTSNTREGHVKGKVPYMAPEVLRLEPVTRAVDIYAAAVVLWEALACRRLFDVEMDGSSWAMVLTMPVPRPSAEGSGLPEIDDIVMQSLSRDPARRPGTALEMAKALAAATRLATSAEVGDWVMSLANDTLAAREEMIRAASAAGVTRAEVVTAGSTPEPPVDRERRRPRARPIVMTMALVLGVVTVGFTGWTVADAPPDAAKTPAATSASIAEHASAFAPNTPDEPPSLSPPREVDPKRSERKKDTRVQRPAENTSRRGPAASSPRSGTGTDRRCDPPYTIDATGKHFKAECLQ